MFTCEIHVIIVIIIDVIICKIYVTKCALLVRVTICYIYLTGYLLRNILTFVHIEFTI